MDTIAHYPLEHIRQLVSRAFRGWAIVGIKSHTVNGWQWVNHEDIDLDDLRPTTVLPLSDMAKIAETGAQKVCLKLTHPNGGVAYPDYYLEEFAVPFRWKPNDHLRVDVNQGARDAYVLAVIGNEALIEYEMPAGTTALWVIKADRAEPHKIRNVSYKSCPRKWLDAIEEAGLQWEGNGQ